MSENIRKRSRWAWALTGSGHWLTETISIIDRLKDIDLFLSNAAVEVLRMYKKKIIVPDGGHIYQDKSASSSPIGAFYDDVYHSIVIAPATSNAVAKFVYGISDDLVSNVFAHGGKTRVPIIVFACDTSPELLSMAPKGLVKVYPRRIDLSNRDILRSFESVTVVESPAELLAAVKRRHDELNNEK